MHHARLYMIVMHNVLPHDTMILLVYNHPSYFIKAIQSLPDATVEAKIVSFIITFYYLTIYY